MLMLVHAQPLKRVMGGCGIFASAKISVNLHYRYKWNWPLSCQQIKRNWPLQGKKLQELIENESLTLNQIYNCDEMGLCYRLLVQKTFAAVKESEAPGMKNPKEWITLMAWSNATGTHKLPLLFVRKAQNPRCFKNIVKMALPVQFYTQKRAWVICDIFSKRYHHKFVAAVRVFQREQGLSLNALLLLDNAPAHPSDVLVSHDKTIRTKFPPLNTTALIQPMD